MKESDVDDVIQESYERNSPSVDVDMGWEMLKMRMAGEKHRGKTPDSQPRTLLVSMTDDHKRSFPPRTFAPRRTSGLRVAVYASIAVVLLAAVAVGSLEAVKYLGNDQRILVIGDDTLGTATTGQTTQTTVTVAQGGNWLRLPLGVEVAGGPVNALVMDPSDPAVLYAGTDQGLFKSTDGAAKWTQLQLGGRVIMIAVDPGSPSTVYVTADWALYKSLDSGETWKQVIESSSYPPGFKQLWIDASTSPSTLYGQEGYGYGPFKSTDGGSTWEDVSITPQGQFFNLTIDPTGHMRYAFVPSDGGPMLMRSSDGGATWEDASAGLPAAVRSGESSQPLLGLDPRDPSRLYLYTELDPLPKVLVSSDGAQTWFELTGAELDWAKAVSHAAPGTPAAAIEAAAAFLTNSDGEVLIDPADPSVLYRGSVGGVDKSIDQGATWNRAVAGMTDSAVYRVVVDPASPSTIYAAASASIVKSTDGGASWGTILESSGSLVLAPSLPSRLYAGTSAGNFRTDDGGATWTQLDASGLPSAPSPLAPLSSPGGLMLVASDRPDTVFASVGDALCVSNDGGNTSHKVAGLPGAAWVVAEAPDDPSTLYAGSISGLFKSTDGGENWAPVGDKSWGGGVSALAIDPFNPSTIYAVQEGESSPSLWRSTDGDETWMQTTFEGMNGAVLSLLFDPRTQGTLYAVTSDMGGTATIHLYRSTDGGATWQDITGELFDQGDYFNIVVDPAPGGGLYVFSKDGDARGLYKWVPGDK